MTLSFSQASAILFHIETIAPAQSLILANNDGWSVAGDAYKCRAFLESERLENSDGYNLTMF